MVDEKDEEEAVSFLCKNKKNVSHIQDYLLRLEQGKKSDISKTIPILIRVFSFYTRQNTWKDVNKEFLDCGDSNDVTGKGNMPVAEGESGISDSNRKKIVAEKKVNLWLYETYKSCIKIILGYFQHPSVKIQVQSFEAVMSIIQAEYITNILATSNTKQICKLNFPNSIFIKVVKQFMLSEAISKEILECFTSLLLQYDDLCFYCVKNIHSLLENQNIANKYPLAMRCIARNTYNILEKIVDKILDTDAECSLYAEVDHLQLDTTQIKKSYKHFFSSAWMALLHLPNLPTITQKKILLILDSKIMPQLADPKLLIDFLTDSYDAGGVSSLLALNGLFVLINQYNLDYPEFYTKLFFLLDVNIFHAKYKARFFHLLDLFLTSTHLPGYLVCAFVKKLTRIALFTPGEDLFMLLKFIKNLMIRHPSSRILIHRQNANEVTNSTDPFNYEEADPFKSNASKSCLWELESLKSHYSRDVVKFLFSFRKEFPLVEDDITEYFDKDFESLIAARLEVDITEESLPPFSIEKRKEIFSLDTDMWCF